MMRCSALLTVFCLFCLFVRISPPPPNGALNFTTPSGSIRFAPDSAVVGLGEVVCSNWTLRPGRPCSLRVGRPTSLFSAVLLLLAGDIETNPGPGPKHPCASCSKAVKSNQRGIFCEVCYQWYHAKASACLTLST